MGTAIRAGGAYVEMLVKDEKFKAAMNAVKARLDGFGKSLNKLGTTFATAGAAITAPLGLAVKSFTDLGDEMTKMSQRTGIAVESLSKLKYAAEQSDVSAEELQSALQKMQKGLESGSAGFASLGLSVERLKGMKPEEAFATIAEEIKGIESPSARAKAAMDVFGRSGANLLPLLLEGADGINKLAADAERLGLVMDGDTSGAATELGDRMADLWKQVGALQVQIGSALAPVLTSLLEKTQPVLKAIIDWVRFNGEWIVSIAKAGAALLAFGAAVKAVGLAISIVTKANPVLLAAAVAIGGLSLAWDAVASSANDAADAIERAADAGERVKSDKGSPAFEGKFPKGRNRQGVFDFSNPLNERPEFEGEFGSGKDPGTGFGEGRFDERAKQAGLDFADPLNEGLDGFADRFEKAIAEFNENNVFGAGRDGMIQKLREARLEAEAASERTLTGGNPLGVSNIAAIQSLQSGRIDVERAMLNKLERIERHLDKGQVGRAG